MMRRRPGSVATVLSSTHVVAQRLASVATFHGHSLAFRTLMSVLHLPTVGSRRSRDAPPATYTGVTFPRALKELRAAVRGTNQSGPSSSGVEEQDDAMDAAFTHETVEIMSGKAMDGLGLSVLQSSSTNGSATPSAQRASRLDRAVEDLLLAAVLERPPAEALSTSFRLLGTIAPPSMSDVVAVSSTSAAWLMQTVCEDLQRSILQSVSETPTVAEGTSRAYFSPTNVAHRHQQIMSGGYQLVHQQFLQYLQPDAAQASDAVVWRHILRFAALVADVDIALRSVETLKLSGSLQADDAMAAAVACARCERLDLTSDMLELARRASGATHPLTAPTHSGSTAISGLQLALNEIAVLANAIPPNGTQVQDLAGQLARILSSTDAGVLPHLTHSVGNACGALLGKAARCTALALAHVPPAESTETGTPHLEDADSAGDPLKLVDTLMHALIESSSEACVRHPLVSEGLLHAISSGRAPSPSRVASLTSALFRRSNRSQLSVSSVLDRYLCEASPQGSYEELDNATRVGLGALPSAVDTVAVRLFLCESHPSKFFSTLALGPLEGNNTTSFARERHFNILVTGVVGLLDSMVPPPTASQVVDAVEECLRRAPSSDTEPLSPPTMVALQRLRCWLWTIHEGNNADASASTLEALLTASGHRARLRWCRTSPVLGPQQLQIGEAQQQRYLVFDDAVFSWLAQACSSTAACGNGVQHWAQVVAVLSNCAGVARGGLQLPTATTVALMSDQLDVLRFCIDVLEVRSAMFPTPTMEALRYASEQLKTLVVCDPVASARLRWLQQQGSPLVSVVAQRTPMPPVKGEAESVAGIFSTALRDPALPKDAFADVLHRLHAEGARVVGAGRPGEEGPRWVKDATPEELLSSDSSMMIC